MLEPYILTFLGWLVGGFSSGVSGLGAMMLALPLMTIGMTPADAVLTCCLTGAPSGLQLAALYRGHGVLDEAKWLWAGCIPGCVAGAFVLKIVPVAWLQIGISLMLAVFLLLQCFGSKIPWTLKAGAASLFATGFAAGFANASVSIVGAPVGIFILLARWERIHALGTMSLLFIMSNWITVAVQWGMGLYTLEHLQWACAGFCGTLIGQTLGFRAGKHINQKMFVRFVLVFLTASAIMLFYKAVV